MQVNTPTVTFDTEGKWLYFPGFVYGLSQPSIVGRLRIFSATDPELVSLDNKIAAFGDDFPYKSGKVTGALGLAARIAHLTIAAQVFSKIPVSDRHDLADEGMGPEGRALVRLALPCHAVEATTLSLQWAVRTVSALMNPAGTETAKVNQSMDELTKQLERFAVPGLNSFHFVRAADELDIPVEHWVAGVFRFGTGCNTRLLASSETDQTPSIGLKIARNKLATAHVLSRAGLPASKPVAVLTAEDAVSAARRLGFPVVIKPVDRDQGEGVFANLADEPAVKQAFSESARFSKWISIEPHFRGKDFRLTVLRGRVVKVEERIAAGILGDGFSTVKELIAKKQAEPRFKKISRETGKSVISLDAEAVSLINEAGLAPDSVIEAGFRLPLRRKNNVSTGGDQVAIALDDVHPDNLALAVRAAALVGLDFAGIDLLIDSIRHSWQETGALICEVNAVPQVGIRTSPTIYAEILRDLVGPIARIPAHLVIIADKAALAESDFLKLADDLSCNGLSTSEGVWIDGKRLQGHPQSAFASARLLLSETAARGAVCVMPADELARKGLPCDHFDSIRMFIDTASLGSSIDMFKPHTSNWIYG